MSKLRLFLAAWRERRLVLKGDLVRTVALPVKNITKFKETSAQREPPLAQRDTRNVYLDPEQVSAA